ncbi:hypothetical protein A0257_05955 [Hymenobacter psoromatis]|nr:hypothetical protein A0257_05955 [Hymenobacter psoromatis]
MLPAALRVYSVETPPGQPPAAPRLPLAFAPFLFLTAAHQALQPHGQPVLSFYLEDAAAGLTVAQLAVVLGFDGPGQASSPGQAPFGAVQLAAGVPPAALLFFLETVENTLRQRGQRRLHLRGYPFCYDAAGAAQLAEALRQRHYQVVLAEENYHLDPARAYQEHLHPSERRRLRRCRQLGLVPEQEPPLLLPWAYEFIARCRQERGQALSLPLARLQELFRAFPRQHLLFSVRKPGGEWAALTIAIQVSDRVLYNFYPASPLADNHLSPVVLLNESLHTYARASGLALVDLGTSTLPAGPNASLLRFKRHLGGVAGLKLSWAKEL